MSKKLGASVGIVTVVYNGAQLIEETILSVINQTYQKIEYVIIDGGSTDGTLDIIKKYEDKITYWCSEPDFGIYDAMNKGVAKSKSEWINFMNAGDSFYNENVLHDVFSDFDHQSAIIYGPVNCFDRYKNVVIKPMKIDKLNSNMIFCHQSSFVKKELLNKYKFDLNYKISADYNLFYQLYKAGYNFFETSYCIANYEIESGLSSKNGYLSAKNNLKINKNWNNPVSRVNFYYKSLIFYMFYSLKRILPFRLMKFLNDQKYKSHSKRS